MDTHHEIMPFSLSAPQVLLATNKPYFLALNRMPKIGPRTVATLLWRWPDLRELFSLSESALNAAGLPLRVVKAVTTFDWRVLDEDWGWNSSPGHKLLTWCDAEYPALLREIHDPPPVLYAIGDVSIVKQTTLAMVGTRVPSITGSETAFRFARELAAAQVVIVSGLARGIDAEAHRGCMSAFGKTIAVMGTGIDCIYPRAHARLAAEIAEKGLLLTEFPLKTSPIAGHFPRRNRIISGLSLATLVVEAAIKSGSLITARMALEQNRDVLAIPSSIYNPQAQGCHQLLQQGAKLVMSSRDVLDELGGWSEGNATEFAVPLARENKNLVKFIGFELTTVDQIVERSKLSVQHVLCGLAELELQGIVRAISGGYMRCTG